MDLDDLIIAAFCTLDDALSNLPHLQARRLRKRGPLPRLSDSEVITMEVIGAYLGLEQDEALFRYFQRHYCHFFPALAGMHRTTFVRQAANLWQVKEQLWQHIASRTSHDGQFGFIDCFPLPVCRFARAKSILKGKSCRRFWSAGEAAFGYDPVARQTFYGFRVHLLVAWPGVIKRVLLTPGNVSELQAAPEVLDGYSGYVLGDRKYWSPALHQQLLTQEPERELALLAPHHKRKYDPRPRWSRWLTGCRYRIETVISQLVQRFALKQVWSRDSWHLGNRLMRCVLSHTLLIHLNGQQENPPLQFAALVP